MVNNGAIEISQGDNLFDVYKNMLSNGRNFKSVSQILKERIENAKILGDGLSSDELSFSDKMDIAKKFGNGIDSRNLTPYFLVSGFNPDLSDNSSDGFEGALVRFDSRYGEKIVKDRLASVSPNLYDKLRENADLLLPYFDLQHPKRFGQNRNEEMNQDIWTFLLNESDSSNKVYNSLLNRAFSMRSHAAIAGKGNSLNLVDLSDRISRAYGHAVEVQGEGFNEFSDSLLGEYMHRFGLSKDDLLGNNILRGAKPLDVQVLSLNSVFKGGNLETHNIGSNYMGDPASLGGLLNQIR